MTNMNQKPKSSLYPAAQRILCVLALLSIPNTARLTANAWLAAAPSSLATTTRKTTRLYSSSSSSSNNNKNLSDPNNDPLALARLRLEMHWNLEEAKEDQECIVEDPSTCNADECPDCNGEGETICRFCRGTAQMYVGSMANRHNRADKFNNNPLLHKEEPVAPPSSSSDTTNEGSFQVCPICQEGHEVCTSCRGTGWVADWAQPDNLMP